MAFLPGKEHPKHSRYKNWCIATTPLSPTMLCFPCICTSLPSFWKPLSLSIYPCSHGPYPLWEQLAILNTHFKCHLIYEIFLVSDEIEGHLFHIVLLWHLYYIILLYLHLCIPCFSKCWLYRWMNYCRTPHL